MSDAGGPQETHREGDGARILRPTSAEGARQIVQEAASRREAIYPVGGGLALDELLPKPRPGIDLSLTGLDRIVEFSPRDLTITVEAGTTLAQLAQTVDEAGLLFPFASNLDERSTIGGVVATAWNGPRRTGWGNLRDYVIGARAIDGRGVAFKSGGKVVKNVAGYDLVKLLVGSRGTLGVITEVTLRLKPRPEANWLASLAPAQGQSLGEIALELKAPRIPYSVYEIAYAYGFHSSLHGENAGVTLRWEGAVEEIDVAKRTVEELVRTGRYRQEPIHGDADVGLISPKWRGEQVALEIQIQAPPTTTQKALAGEASTFAAESDFGIATFHPRSGQALLRFRRVSDPESMRLLLAKLRADIGEEGYVAVTCDSAEVAPTRELRFGRTSSPQFLMEKVKAAMDPYGILNPGRYVFVDAFQTENVASNGERGT